MRRRDGFTLIELTVVVSIAGIMVALGALTFSGYFQKSAARRAAHLFARDLLVARSFAVRSQEPVVVRVFEDMRWYQIVSGSTATEVVRRRFAGSSPDVGLSGIVLEVSGDTLVFNTRGQIEMSAVGGALGTAAFSAGATTYRVHFNRLGTSRVEGS